MAARALATPALLLVPVCVGLGYWAKTWQESQQVPFLTTAATVVPLCVFRCALHFSSLRSHVHVRLQLEEARIQALVRKAMGESSGLSLTHQQRTKLLEERQGIVQELRRLEEQGR